MEWLGPFFRKLSILFRRTRFRSELDEEMAFHQERAEQALIAAGIPPREARYVALRQFGNAAKLRDRGHEAVSFRFETVLQDLRFALRQLRRNLDSRPSRF